MSAKEFNFKAALNQLDKTGEPPDTQEGGGALHTAGSSSPILPASLEHQKPQSSLPNPPQIPKQ